MRLGRIEILVIGVLCASLFLQPLMLQSMDFVDNSNQITSSRNVVATPSENYDEMDLSAVNISLILNETEGTVLGNFSIDYHNSDTVAFS